MILMTLGVVGDDKIVAEECEYELVGWGWVGDDECDDGDEMGCEDGIAGIEHTHIICRFVINFNHYSTTKYW